MKHLILFILLTAIFFQVSADTIIHVVQRGESLESIAKKYGINVLQIKDLNPNMGNLLYAGLKLNIPENLPKENGSSSPVQKQDLHVERESSVQASESSTFDAVINDSYAAVPNNTNSQVENNSINNVGNDFPFLFITAKYDYLGISNSETSFGGLSIGLLTNPCSFENKKISWTMQLGAFIDYYQSFDEYVDMHYVGLSLPLHLLGCQFSDGKGNGLSIHGGFEFTWRIDGSAKIKGYDKSLNPFEKDDFGDARLGHWDAGFGGAIDIVFSRFYASFGYNIFADLVKTDRTNAYGPFFCLGIGF